jgi:hypothetical protein
MGTGARITLSEVKPGPLTKVKAGQRRAADISTMQTTVARTAPSVAKHPFAVPSRLTPDLARVLAYWRGLLRGSAQIPFADDLDLTDLPDLADRLLVIEVFGRPERFRFAIIGDGLKGEAHAGRFLDEVQPAPPFEYLRAQASATVECGAPTCFKREPEPGEYRRLLLPFWGDGRLSMLLGAVVED